MVYLPTIPLFCYCIAGMAAAFQSAYAQYNPAAAAAFYAASFPPLGTPPMRGSSLPTNNNRSSNNNNNNDDYNTPRSSELRRHNPAGSRMSTGNNTSPTSGGDSSDYPSLRHQPGMGLHGSPFSIDGLISSVGSKLCSPHSPGYDGRPGSKGYDSSGKTYRQEEEHVLATHSSPTVVRSSSPTV